MSQLIDFTPPPQTVRPGAETPAQVGVATGWPRRRAELVGFGARAWEQAVVVSGWLAKWVRPVGRWAITVAKTITVLGWTLLGLAALAWLAAALFGWDEAAIVAIFCLVAVGLAALFTIGRSDVQVNLQVTPQRVRVTQSSIASFEISNGSGRRQRSVRLRLPVGQASAYFTMPSLAVGESYDEWVTIPTSQRGVVPIGPLLTYRDDPLGIVRRQVSWTEVVDLFIHPQVVAIDELAAGLLRDLEGQSTLDISNSDLAFHALRDYQAGDDRRYIHWKSSARLSAVTGEDRFMVRQFLDTRRTHIGLISDLSRANYADEDEFEMALSCAASVATRAVIDELGLTVLCGDQVVDRPTSNYALDPYARAELGNRNLAVEFERVRTRAPDASIIILVTGSQADHSDLRRGRGVISEAIPLLVVRVVAGQAITLRQSGGLTELTIGALDQLPRAMRGGSTS